MNLSSMYIYAASAKMPGAYLTDTKGARIARTMRSSRSVSVSVALYLNENHIRSLTLEPRTRHLEPGLLCICSNRNS